MFRFVSVTIPIIQSVTWLGSPCHVTWFIEYFMVTWHLKLMWPSRDPKCRDYDWTHLDTLNFHYFMSCSKLDLMFFNRNFIFSTFNPYPLHFGNIQERHLWKKIQNLLFSPWWRHTWPIFYDVICIHYYTSYPNYTSHEINHVTSSVWDITWWK